jgi:hypothetical protein
VKPSTFVVTDPRTFDGDPYEVAERAIRQAAAVNTILLDCLEKANLMARNAEMERNLHNDEDPRAGEWETTPQGARIQGLITAANNTEKTLNLLARAAGFDPRKAR